MPQNTRVYRCVSRLKKKYGYKSAIAICQKSTRQNYMSGKTLRKIKKNKRKNKRFNKTRKK